MKGIMVQGTGSGVGKSVIVAALCRYFYRKGYRVTPFKAQNMALNSYITKEGAEIGRAQALQAMAAGVEPTWAMNPVLLKASGPLGTQVILRGKPVGTMKPSEYYAYRQKAWEAVLDGWEHLSGDFDIAIVEGAGSPAEVNLRDVEIVNMAVAREFSLPVILVGDIDRGGVFASLYGTLALLEDDARYIKAMVINKFRGDLEILRPGIEEIEKRTGLPVIGVIPYGERFLLEEEDSLGLYKPKTEEKETVKVTVLKLPLISNFTDFLPLMYEDDIDLVFSLRREDILHSDLVIIPGTKSTIRDLEFIRSQGIDGTLKEGLSRGIPVMGICGGYQMLGESLRDDFSVESDIKETRGLGFLPIRTEFAHEKTTTQVIARQINPVFGEVMTGEPLWGYEIHMGRTDGPSEGIFAGKRLATEEEVSDGMSAGLVAGTYLHGIFENDSFRLSLVNFLRVKKGLPERPLRLSYRTLREKTLDEIADLITGSLNMDFVESLIE